MNLVNYGLTTSCPPLDKVVYGNAVKRIYDGYNDMVLDGKLESTHQQQILATLRLYPTLKYRLRI